MLPYPPVLLQIDMNEDRTGELEDVDLEDAVEVDLPDEDIIDDTEMDLEGLF